MADPVSDQKPSEASPLGHEFEPCPSLLFSGRPARYCVLRRPTISECHFWLLDQARYCGKAQVAHLPPQEPKPAPSAELELERVEAYLAERIALTPVEMEARDAQIRSERDKEWNRALGFDGSTMDPEGAKYAMGERWANHAANCHGAGQSDAIRDANAGTINDMLQPLIQHVQSEARREVRAEIARKVCAYCDMDYPRDRRHHATPSHAPGRQWNPCRAVELGVLESE